MTKVCRLCLAKLQRGSKYFNINAVESFTGFMPYRDQLTTCIPEMALDLIPNPVICNNCRTALKSSYDFKSRCLMVEKRIRHYVASQPSDTTVYNLSEIDTSNLPKPAKFEVEVMKEPPKLVPILPKVEVQRVPTSHPSSILSNLLTVKDEVILPNSEIEISNVGFTQPRGKGPSKSPNESCSTAVRHTAIEKDEHGLYTCNHCDKKFPNVPSLHSHKTRVHEEDYLCNFCNIPFRTLQNLRKHNQQCQKIRSSPGVPANSVLTKRPHLPTKAKNHLKRWLFNHTDHPYPTDVEKQQLMKETNLSLLQVENWFINARRRILADLTKLKNMRGGSRRGRSRGRGRGRGTCQEIDEDLFDEDPDKLFGEDEEARAASRLLKDLEDQDVGAGEIDDADEGEEGGAETSTEMSEGFLEESQDGEVHQEEIITVNPLEDVMESSMDSRSNDSNENAHKEDRAEDDDDDPLENVALSTLASRVKMEVDVDER